MPQFTKTQIHIQFTNDKGINDTINYGIDTADKSEIIKQAKATRDDLASVGATDIKIYWNMFDIR